MYTRELQSTQVCISVACMTGHYPGSNFSADACMRASFLHVPQVLPALHIAIVTCIRIVYVCHYHEIMNELCMYRVTCLVNSLYATFTPDLYR